MAVVFLKVSSLEGEEQQEGHHKTEQSHGLREGETQDGVWEQLLLEGGVPGIADDEGTEHCSDTSTWNEAYNMLHTSSYIIILSVI